MLKSTGSTVTWYLTQKNNDVKGTVRLIGPLAQFSAATNDKEVDELHRHLVPGPALPGQLPFESLNADQQFPNGSCHDGSHQTAAQFSDPSPLASLWGVMMDILDFRDEQRALTSHHFAQLIEKVGKPEEAQEIRRHCDAPATDKEQAALPAPDGDLPGRPEPDVEPPRQEEPWRNSPLSEESEQDGESQADE